MGVIIIQDNTDFDIRHILDCGQIFRYKQLDSGDWEIISLDKRCIVKPKDKGYEII